MGWLYQAASLSLTQRGTGQAQPSPPLPRPAEEEKEGGLASRAGMCVVSHSVLLNSLRPFGL